MSLLVALLLLAQEPPPPREGAEERPRRPAPADQDRLKVRLEELNARLKEKPDDAELYLQRSDVRRRLGDGKGADEDVAKAHELNPDLKRRVRPPGPPEPPGPNRRSPFPPGRMGREGEPPPMVREEDLREYLQEFEPETGRRLREARAEGRGEEAERLLHEAQGRMRATRELKERDPKGYERLLSLRALERECGEMADSIRQAPPAQRDEAVRKLDEHLGRLFDLREENRARELEELKRRVADLEKMLEGRKAAKARIVENRRKELLGEPRSDNW